MHARKLEEIILHLGEHPNVKNLGATKLWKLIYFIDARSLRTYGHSVTESEFIKYEHGPVPSRGEKHLKRLIKSGEAATSPREIGGKTLNEVTPSRSADVTVFSEEELALIDEVCRELGGETAVALSDLSHKEPAWHYAKMMDKLSPELMAYGHSEDPEDL